VTTDERCLALSGPLAYRVALLWRRQSTDWDALQAGLADLAQSLTRTFEVTGSRVVAQCNPARTRSASAKIDPASLAARPCFLCGANLPPMQRAVAYRDGWLVLCNPAPIFDPHFTIVSEEHEPQRIMPWVGLLLDLARDLEGHYTVFYNGPLCGASAPDHMHLQASPVGATPFENELAAALCADKNTNGQRWIEWLRLDPVRVGLTRPSHRPAVLFVAQAEEPLVQAIQEVIRMLGTIHPAEPEPMLNLFATFADERWLVWLYPRRAHRPRCYGEKPDEFLVSPGAIDLAGLLITPRREDFERINASVIASVFDEVLLSRGDFAELRNRLQA